MTSIPSEKTYKSKLQNAEECAEIFYSEAVFKTKQPAKLDKVVGHLCSVSSVMILSSDTTCRLNQLLSNTEAAMLFSKNLRGEPLL